MAVARSEQIDLEFTEYFHCVPRCVRRAHLCGVDPITGEDFEHRRAWIGKRIRELSSTFAVDVHAYAVMSTHLHVLLRVDVERARGWDDDEVRRRFGEMFPLALQRASSLNAKGQRKAIEDWRERLGSLSWAMRSLNEWIARKANREDGCRGRFWDGRFQSQPLLDPPSILTCAAFIDLNPIRNGDGTKSGSMATSLGLRLEGLRKILREEGVSSRSMLKVADAMDALPNRKRREAVPAGLVAMADQVPRTWASDVPAHAPVPSPIGLSDYIRLLEWTRRSLVDGLVAQPPKGTLECFQLATEPWLRTMGTSGLSRQGVLGNLERVREYAEAQGKAWVRGVGRARRATT